MLVHILKISSSDILEPYLAIGISKELNEESKNQVKILHDFQITLMKIDSGGHLIIKIAPRWLYHYAIYM